MKENVMLSNSQTAGLLKAHAHTLYYLRHDNNVPYGCVLAMLMPDKTIQCGWSLMGTEDEKDPTVFFEKEKARRIAATRVVAENDSEATAKIMGKKNGAAVILKNMKKAKGTLYLKTLRKTL